MNPNAPIGVFDSGFGGLTVLRAIVDRLPHEQVVYFADTAHLPYGNKGKETIVRYCLDALSFFRAQNVKLLVVACNTACCYALEIMREQLSIPVIGITEQSIEEVLRFLPAHRVGILGTRGTIASEFYQKELTHKSPSLKLFPLACPLFVPLVEEGYLEHPITDKIIEEYLTPLKQEHLDGLLLACTHYPLLLASIRKFMGNEILLIDPAAACAQKTHQVLSQHQLLHPSSNAGECYFFSSDDSDQFRRMGQMFLTQPIRHLSLTTHF